MSFIAAGVAIGVTERIDGSPGTGVLDVFPGSIGGFSLRKLRSAYTGPVVELQVSGAVATDDFFDDAGTLINSLSQTPTQWLVDIGQPANQGLRVKTLYNQSLGATFNIEQTNTGLQPHIYQNGAADYYRMGTYNRITLQWDSFDDALSSTSWAGYNNVSLFVVEELLATEPAHLLIQGSSGSFYRVVSEIGGGSASPNNAGTVYVGGIATGSTTRAQLYADIQGVYNGQAIGGIAAQYIDISMPNPGYASWHLNKYSSGSFFSNECKIAELLMYPSDMTTEVVAISNEQSLFYGLPDPAPWLNTYSLDFDGVNDVVQCGLTPSFEITDSFSASAWVKLDTLGTQRGIVGKFTSGALGWHMRIQSTNIIRFVFATNGSNYFGADSTTTLATDTWYHVVITYDGSQANTGMKIYINGSLETMTTLGGGTVTTIVNTIPNHIGASAGSTASGFWDGNIEEVAVFSSELSAGNVTTIYNGGLPTDLELFSPLPTAWYRMGDGAVYPMINNEQAYSHRSVDFDGVADYVSTSSTIATLGITNKFTVSCWIKADTLVGSWEGIMGCVSSDSWTDGFSIYMNSAGAIGFWVNHYITNLAISSVSTISTGTWYHVLACYDGSLGSNNMELFVNGASVATDTLTANVTDNSGTLCMADASSGGFHHGMNGNIDDFAIWNTDERANVATIYNNGVPNDISALNPISYYKMGDGDTYPTLTDNGSLGNDGTMTNMIAADITGAQSTGMMENMVSGDIVADVPIIPIQEGLTFNIDCLDTASYSGSGTTWASTVNSANNGTLVGDVALVGGHMVFAGSDDYVTFPQNTNGLTQDPMTVEMWLYRDGTSSDFLLGTRNPNTLGDGLCLSSTLTRFYAYGEDSKSAGNNFLLQLTAMPSGVWLQVVFTTGGDDVVDNILYINGSAVAWYAPTTYYGNGGYASASTDPLTIGADSSLGNDFNGKVDIVRIYDRVLTPAEVTHNFDAIKGRFGL